MNIVLYKISDNYRRKKTLLGILLITLALICSGCGDDDDDKKIDSSKVAEYSSGKIGLTVEVDKTEMLLAEDVLLRFTATAPKGWDIKFPKFSEKIGKLDINGKVDQKDLVDTEVNKETKILEVELSAFLAGSYTIPEFDIEYSNGSDEKELVIKTKPIDITVKTLLGTKVEPQLKDISGVLSLQKDYTLWYVVGSVVLLIVLAIIILSVIKYLHRRARLRAISKPFYIALKNLDELEKSGSIEKGLDDYIYTEVSDILRYYIESRFGITASKNTTEEFLSKISDEKLLISSYSELLSAFLQKCDIVKFAKYDASEDECRNVLKSCRNFVLETKRDEIKYHGEFGEVDG